MNYQPFLDMHVLVSDEVVSSIVPILYFTIVLWALLVLLSVYRIVSILKTIN